jgi:hypothetical protein
MQNQPMAYTSILVKGSTIETTTNAAGKFHLDLLPGVYTLVVQFLGYERVRKKTQ